MVEEFKGDVMTKNALYFACLVSIVFSHGARGQEDEGAESQPAESLFRWRYDGVWNSPSTERDRIVTDRPHLAEATSTVGLGTIQLETGYSFSSDNAAGGRTQSHSFPEPLLRVGAFAEWFELRLGWNYLVDETNPRVGPTTTLRGSDDLYLGAKVALFKQYGWLPDFTVFPQARLPIGTSGITAEEIRPGVNLAYSWAVTKIVEIECNTVLNRERDDSGDFYLEVFQTVNLEYDVSEKVMLFTEYVAFAPSGSRTAQFQNYFHYGAHYFFTPNFQFDIHSAVGLNSAADNLAFTGMGLSYRF